MKHTLILLAICGGILTAALQVKKITVYNQGWAFVEEHRSLTLDKTGDVSFTLTDLPQEIAAASVSLNSETIQILTKEIVRRPVTKTNLLNANIGNTLRLVHYAEDGSIGYSTTGLLISNDSFPIFRIDGQLVLDPPYEVLFDEIPADLSNRPYLNCTGNTHSKYGDLGISYLTQGLSWSADYTLTVTDDSRGELESWFTVNNGTRQDWSAVDLTLVSGNLNFNESAPRPVLKAMARQNAVGADFMESKAAYEIGSTEDYALFRLPDPVTLPHESTKQFRYVSAQVPVVKSYHATHSLGYGGRNSTDEPVPVTARITFPAADVGAFNHPAGTIRVLETTEDRTVFVGSDHLPIIQKEGDFKINTGKTMDVTANFTITSYEVSRRNYVNEMTARFKNVKDQPVTVEWLESLSGDWEIDSSSIPWEKKDAATARMLVDVPANGEQEVTLKVTISRN